MSTQDLTFFEWLGSKEYEKALDLQCSKAEELRGKKHLHVFGLEHPAVVTFGKRAEAAVDLPWGEEVLKNQGISLVATDRGGQATLHSPGQLVIYPIVPLEPWGFSVRAYVRFLEEATQAAFAKVGVFTELHEGDPGVYTSEGKIAFCGIRIDRGVARHGLSLNISNDLHLFQWIRPCGAMARPLDRLQEYCEMSPAEFFVIWQETFEDLLRLRVGGDLSMQEGQGIKEVLHAKSLTATPHR